MNVVMMDRCHIILRRPWKCDKTIAHDSRRNPYQVEKDGKKYRLHHLPKEYEKDGRVMLCLVLGCGQDLEEHESGDKKQKCVSNIVVQNYSNGYNEKHEVKKEVVG
jgi:hypothetical protein